MAEYNGSGTLQRTIVWGNYIDAALRMRAGGSDYYYLHDHLYSPAVLIGFESGQWRPVERYEYDAYGTARVINRGPDNAWFTADDVVTGSSAINTTLFTGRTLDSLDSANLKIMYYRNRYTDPFTGRFLQQDPMRYVDGMNLYGYVKHRPTITADAYGLFHDFNPNGPRPRTIPPGGYVYDFTNFSAIDIHVALFAFYSSRLVGGGGHFWPDGSSADYVILGGGVLDDIRGQSMLISYNDSLRNRLEWDAHLMLNNIGCGNTGIYADRDSTLIYPDYFTSPNIGLGLGRFTVWWDAYCSVGPKKCNVRDGRFKDSCGSSALWSCNISWTLYDRYDFEWYDPFAAMGYPFHIFAWWSTSESGITYSTNNE